MAEPVGFNSGVELNDTAVEAQAGPSPRSIEEWFDTDDDVGNEADATQLPAVLILSTAIGLSTQCPTDSVNERLLLETKVTVFDNVNDPTDSAGVSNNPLWAASEAFVQLLLGDADTVVELQGYAAATTNNHIHTTYNMHTHPSTMSTNDNTINVTR